MPSGWIGVCGSRRDRGNVSAIIPPSSNTIQSPGKTTVPLLFRSNAMSSQFRASCSAVGLYRMPTCSTNGATTALRTTSPFETVCPSAPPASTRRSFSSATARNALSHWPEIISSLDGSNAVTAPENIESATTAATGLPASFSAIAARIMMSVAIECPSSATSPVTFANFRPAAITRRVSATNRAVVPLIEVTSPDIAIGFRPCPSKSNASTLYPDCASVSE